MNKTRVVGLLSLLLLLLSTIIMVVILLLLLVLDQFPKIPNLAHCGWEVFWQGETKNWPLPEVQKI
jgi:hypothetical protein